MGALPDFHVGKIHPYLHLLIDMIYTVHSAEKLAIILQRFDFMGCSGVVSLLRFPEQGDIVFRNDVRNQNRSLLQPFIYIHLIL